MRISDWSSDVCSSDLRIEIARLAGEPLVDLVGDAVGDGAPVGGRRVELRALHLGFTVDVPQAVLHLHPAVRLQFHVAADQRLGVDEAAVAEAGPQSSEARRGGKECVSTCRSRWSQYHKTNKTNTEKKTH